MCDGADITCPPRPVGTSKRLLSIDDDRHAPETGLSSFSIPTTERVAIAKAGIFGIVVKSLKTSCRQGHGSSNQQKADEDQRKLGVM